MRMNVTIAYQLVNSTWFVRSRLNKKSVEKYVMHTKGQMRVLYIYQVHHVDLGDSSQKRLEKLRGFFVETENALEKYAVKYSIGEE